MSEEIKGLIEKIQREGIQAAQEEAKEIEAEAQKQAREIVNKARQEAERLLSDARKEISRQSEKEQAALKQAARDTLLALKTEINAMLQRLLQKAVGATLSPQFVGKIIAELIKNSAEQQKAGIEVFLNKDEFAELQKEIFAHLGQELKKQVVLKPAQEIGQGFAISFDQGKSQFDFSLKALSEYIGNYLKPKLAELLNQASPEP